jgi:hypothetical protein
VTNEDGGVAISSATALLAMPSAQKTAIRRILLFTTPRRYNDEPMYRLRETRKLDPRSPK